MGPIRQRPEAAGLITMHPRVARVWRDSPRNSPPPPPPVQPSRTTSSTACVSLFHHAELHEHDPDLPISATGQDEKPPGGAVKHQPNSCQPSADVTRQRSAEVIPSNINRNNTLRGAPARIRTCGTRFRKPMLYPLSYGGGAGAIGGRKPGAGPLRIGRCGLLEPRSACSARLRRTKRRRAAFD